MKPTKRKDERKSKKDDVKAEPRLLVDAEAAVGRHISGGEPPDLQLRYWCQADPDRVFESLRDGTPLPDRYESRNP